VKKSIDMRFPYAKLVLIDGKGICMEDRCMKMISVTKERVLVIIDIVIRLLGGLIIMGTC